jgi:hypothetical protein
MQTETQTNLSWFDQIKTSFPDVQLFKLKGYSDSNESGEYDDAKKPYKNGWNTPEFKGTPDKVVQAWINDVNNGWIGFKVPEGYIILDVDNKHNKNAPDLMAKVLKGEGIKCHHIVTPNGRQMIFKAPEIDMKQGAKMYTPLGIVIDTRVHGKGFIVYPTPNTADRYVESWCNDELDVFPIWLQTMWNVNSGENADGQDLPNYPIGDGGRNDFMFKWGCKIASQGQSKEQVTEVLQLINEYLVNPPLDIQEVDNCVKQAFQEKYVQVREQKQIEWERQTLSNQSKIEPTRTNVELILNNDPNLFRRFAYNEFTKQIEIIGDVPWKRVACTNKWEDSDDSGLRVYIDRQYGISPKDAINDVVNTVSSENSFHPVKDYFNTLPVWDGVERVKSLFIDYMGVNDCDLIREQTEIFFKAVVSRTFEAGCKWDYVVLFKGDQGLGKSSFCRYITPYADWFNDSITDVENKDAMQSLQGSLIVEFAELSAMTKKESEIVKGFLTRQVDKYRPSYGRHEVTRPRQCVFIGTTNDDQPIKDETGGRRWWVMEVTKKWFEQEKVLGKVNIEQLWAEALHLYHEMKANNGYLALPIHLEKLANVIQRENTMLGVYEGEIVATLDDGVHGVSNSKFERICAKHLWEYVLNRNINDIKATDIKRINAIIETHPKYVKHARTNYGTYGKVQVYERVND